jgi:Tetratricopeptide repeat
VTTPRVSLRPVVSWPETIAPGESHLVTVDLSLDGSPEDWPYDQEEYAVGCLLTGDPRFSVKSVGDTTLVVHRFGGTYGPAKFTVSLATARVSVGDGLRLTLLTAGGFPFRQVTRQVEIVHRTPPPPVIPPAPLPGTGDQGPADGRRKPYRLEVYEPGSVPRPMTGGRVQPGRLLAAASRVVPFTSRASELQELGAWAHDPRDVLMAKLVFGPLGQGKSRLADEFASGCAAEGWTVLHARLPGEGDVPPPGASPPSDGRTLVMVDYAERWPVQALRELFTDPVLHRGRALLLARTGDLWWQTLAAELDTAGVNATALALTPLTNTPADRQAAFRAAVTAFAQLYGTEAPPDAMTRSYAGSADDSVLAIHMAALATVDAYMRGTTPPDRPGGFSAYLLDRERAYWEACAVGTAPEIMARAVFIASLMGPMSPVEGAAMLRRAAIVPDASRAAIADVIAGHATCYPPTHRDSVLEPLYPDQLAEDFLARSLPGSGHDASPDLWAASALTLLLAPEPGGYPLARAATAVTVLVETASRWPHVGAAALFPLLQDHPELAIAAGGATLAKLAELPGVDGAVLRAIEELLPDARRVGLDAGAAEITARLASLSQGLDLVEKARLYEALGKRLRDAGQPGEAVAATARAVAAYRDLALQTPAAFEPDLAGSLKSYGARLAEAGRAEEALSAASEAVQISRRLAIGNRELGEPGLAASLNNLSNLLGGTGRTDAALEAISEAVTIRRRLAETDPAANLPSLALSLTNLSVQLSGTARHADALPPATEAVAILRALADADRGNYLPDLATSLLNLAILLTSLGSVTEAAGIIQEATTIHYELATANPAAYQPDLATSLLNLGSTLIELGRYEEALDAVVAAITLYRALAEENAEAYLPRIAMSQLLLGSALTDLGRTAQAMALTEEAVSIYRGLAESDPRAGEPGLALALNDYAMLLARLSRHDEALAVVNESAQMYRRLAAASPRYRADLARSLNNLAVQLAMTDNRSAALLAAEEATEVYRAETAEYPQYQQDLAHSERTLDWLRQRRED